jgi:hypothetical protein
LICGNPRPKPHGVVRHDAPAAIALFLWRFDPSSPTTGRRAVEGTYIAFSQPVDLANALFYPVARQYLSDMAKVHSRAIPYLTPRPFDDGSGWYVEAQWVDRPPERLGHFAIYSEARDWIALESVAYFVLRELGQPVAGGS